MKTYEVVVIGGGPSGYVAAIRAAKLGKTVALVEARDLGGTCLNRGCIPSKTLLRHAEVIDSIEKAKSWGIETGPVKVTLSKMMERKDQVIQTLRNGIGHLMKQGKIDVLNGYGEVEPDGIVRVDQNGSEETIKGDKLILATGSKPIVPPIPGLEEGRFQTSDTIFGITELPESLVIVGGGIIGVEFACIFAALGVPVTIVEMGSRIVPSEDPQAAKVLAKSLKKKGISILTATKVTAVEQGENGQTVHVESEKGQSGVLDTGMVLLSVGRSPNLSAFDSLKLEMNGPFVKVDEHMATSLPNVYAAGDLVGNWQLAHVASAEGLVAAANAAGEEETIDYHVVPRCVYTSPEIASVGMTEEEAEQKGISFKVVKIDHAGNGKALTLDEKEGFTKLIADTTYGEILGVSMVGFHVTEMIAEPSAFMRLEGTVDELATMIHAHPTVTEALYEAAASWLGKGVHY
ncbi:dihydrolipoyl dehydrogenase [Microbacterium sp. APC 3898]|uniref:Dihydrolipoyl dehydrogenase n=1 Tax=Planococcus notacanthi TaxID=3035188 RepID=A0ABT7ZJN6_9BACL|nr:MULTISPECIES: dihydrolipoyl dehydrogenase [Terrabacteria group]MDN3427343.1 dihydrolipoyl dehydrogenase [Planococcus sp. APC 4016]MDN3499625.1 dihydrolipoyl dehydrogenase [Microbacterium sp. APC 3898]